LNAEWFVGGLAIAMASMVTWNAVAFSPALYDLRTVSAVQARFGRKAACGMLLAIAAFLLATGIMILSGLRPGYALPGAIDKDPLSDHTRIYLAMKGSRSLAITVK